MEDSRKIRGIGFKLTAIMLCVILLGVAVTFGIAMTISGNVIMRESLEKIKWDTKSEAGDVDKWLNYHKAVNAALASALTKIDDHSAEYLEPILGAVMDDNPVYLDVYIGFPDNTYAMATGWEAPDDWLPTQRDWYQLALTDPNKVHVTIPYADSMTGELCVTFAKAVKKGNTIVGVAANDILVTEVQEKTLSVTLGSDGYAMLVDENGDILVHPNEKYAPTKEDEYSNITEIDNGAYKNLWNHISASDEAYKYVDANGTAKYYTRTTLESAGWIMITALPAKIVTQPIINTILIVIPIAILILVFAVFLIFLTIRGVITKPIADLAKVADDLAAGDTGIQVAGNYPGEMGTLASAFQRIADSVDNQVRLTRTLAGGDLTIDVPIRSDRDVMGIALREFVGHLRSMVSDIADIADRVTKGSEQIVIDSQVLTHDSRDEVISVEQLTENALALSDHIAKNTDLAEEAEHISSAVKQSAEKGNGQMEQMLVAVKEINDASKGIEKVMKVIGDIAFQTNILALNAAVEAARAGQHGKGFAVVAEEVRNLAAKSAEAAKDTESLITNSIEKASLGARIAGETSESLQGIVEGITQSAEIVAQILRSGAEQNNSIADINKGISQVSGVIRHSNDAASQSADASQEMNAQAHMLKKLVSRFKLR